MEAREKVDSSMQVYSEGPVLFSHSRSVFHPVLVLGLIVNIRIPRNVPGQPEHPSDEIYPVLSLV